MLQIGYNARYTFILLIVLLQYSAVAQTEKDVKVVMKDYSAHVVSLEPAIPIYQPAMPLHSIEVFDARFDTLSAGLIPSPLHSRLKLLHLNKNTSHAVKEYFSSLVHLASPENNANAFTLVCFIKKLFLSDFIYMDNNNTANTKSPVYEIKSGVMAVIEFYATKGNTFIPLYRFDTTATGTKEVLKNSRHYLEIVLTASLRKLTTLNWEKTRLYIKPKTRAEIDSFNNSRFTIPILSENPRKGLYPNFESFRNNTPVDSNFSVERSAKGDYLYLKNNKGEEFLQTDLWGYCDGGNMYIFGAGNYFKLYRYGNTFMIYGAKDFTSTRRLRMNFGLIDLISPNSNYSKTKTVNSYTLVQHLFQLDMESGELY